MLGIGTGPSLRVNLVDSPLQIARRVCDVISCGESAGIDRIRIVLLTAPRLGDGTGGVIGECNAFSDA